MKVELRICDVPAIEQFFSLLIDLVRQSIPVKVYEGEGTFAFGTAVVEITSHTDCCQWYNWTGTHCCRTSYVPTLSSGTAQCSGLGSYVSAGDKCGLYIIINQRQGHGISENLAWFREVVIVEMSSDYGV